MSYILTSIWVLCTLNAGLNLHFQHFSQQTPEKGRKSKSVETKLGQKVFFKFATKRWSRVSFPEKHVLKGSYSELVLRPILSTSVWNTGETGDIKPLASICVQT